MDYLPCCFVWFLPNHNRHTFQLSFGRRNRWLISATFFIAWALIWFGIGRHYSLDYELKEQAFIKKHEGIDETIRLTMFKKAYFSNIAHMLSRVFFIAVPFYVAANVKDTVTLKNCIYIAILMIASIALYGYYKKNNVKDITL